MLTWLGVGCGCGVQQLDELVSCFIKFLCLFLQVDNVLQFFLENDSLEFEEIVKKYSDELSETVFFLNPSLEYKAWHILEIMVT